VFFNLEGVWLLSGVNLSSEVGRSTWALEVASKEWVENVAEEDLGTAELWESEPKDEGELGEVVEWEPVSGVKGGLKDAKEGEGNPVGQPLSVIGLLGSEESLKRVVGRDEEASEVDEQLTSQVKEDQEEVENADTANDVDLWDIGLLLEINESGVFGELLVQLGQSVVELSLRLILESHFGIFMRTAVL